MDSRGRGRGGGGSRGRFSRASPGADGGFCSLHGKPRTRRDLIPWSQQPGKMRCLPLKECTLNRDGRRVGGDRGMGVERRRGAATGAMALRGRSPPLRGRGVGIGMRGGRGVVRGAARFQEGRRDVRRERGPGAVRDSALCRLHRRRRLIASMREVGRGVFECVEGSRCRQTPDRPIRGGFERRGRGMAMPRERRGATAYRNPRDRDVRRLPRRGDRPGLPAQDHRSDEANASVWLPSAGAGAGGGAGVRRRYGRVERKVWCALHGKSLPLSACKPLRGCCYVCLNPSACLAAPLEEDTERLVNRSCPEALCSLHHTLRHVGFLELNEKKVAYQCVAGHTCRGVTIPHPGQDPAAAAAAKTAAVRLAEAEEEDGIYMGPRATGSFLPQSGRDAVSSFFM